MKKLFGGGRWLIIIICILFYFWINERMLASQLVSLYDNVGIGYQCGIILMLLAGIYCMLNFKYLSKLKSIESTTFIALMVYMNVISFIYAAFYSNFESAMLLGLAPPFLYYLMFGMTSKNKLSNFVAICMVVVILMLFYNYTTSLTILADRWNTDSFEGGSASYFILLLIPFALCSKWKILHYIALLVGIAIMVTSSKRGGAVAVMLMMVAYFYISAYISSKHYFKIGWPIRLVLLSLILVSVIYFFVDNVALNNIAVFEKFGETQNDGGSGRTEKWVNVINMILGSDLFSLIFGHGYGAVVLNSKDHMSAHNDFLEAFYDYGFIGFSLFILLLTRLLYLNRKLIKIKSEYAASMTCSTILFVILSSISHTLIYFANFSILALFWGYIAGITKHIQYKNIPTRSCN